MYIVFCFVLYYLSKNIFEREEKAVSAYNPKKKEYNIRYAKEKMKRVPFDIQIVEYDRIKAAAEKLSVPVNTFIKSCINIRLKELETAGIIPGSTDIAVTAATDTADKATAGADPTVTANTAGDN